MGHIIVIGMTAKAEPIRRFKMTEENINITYEMLYLTSCALNNVIPDRRKIEDIDLECLFKMC